MLPRTCGNSPLRNLPAMRPSPGCVWMTADAQDRGHLRIRNDFLRHRSDEGRSGPTFGDSFGGGSSSPIARPVSRSRSGIPGPIPRSCQRADSRSHRQTIKTNPRTSEVFFKLLAHRERFRSPPVATWHWRRPSLRGPTAMPSGNQGSFRAADESGPVEVWNGEIHLSMSQSSKSRRSDGPA
jgi:hypothetical protein